MIALEVDSIYSELCDLINHMFLVTEEILSQFTISSVSMEMFKRKKIELSTRDFKIEIYCVIESRNRIFYTKYFHYQQRKSITHDKKIKRRYIRDNFIALNLKEQNQLVLFGFFLYTRRTYAEAIT